MLPGMHHPDAANASEEDRNVRRKNDAPAEEGSGHIAHDKVIRLLNAAKSTFEEARNETYVERKNYDLIVLRD